MKRQRNIQQVNEHDKKPPKKKKKAEETGSLAEKGFRMIVNIIKNLENQMDLQINRLEKRTEKM